jgi:hypothetical protein
MLADTGGGSMISPFELLLEETDCVLCDGTLTQTVTVTLGGSYAGSYPLYLMRVELPTLHFDHDILVVGVPTVPIGIDGIACFPFVNRFTYGNFSDRNAFGLEV